MTPDLGVILICATIAIAAGLVLRALGEVANQLAQLRTEMLRYHTRMGEGHLLREIAHTSEKMAEYLHRISDRDLG